MIARAEWAVGGAFAVSLLVHGVLLAGLSVPSGEPGAAGGEASIAMIGQSFENRASGTVSANPPRDTLTAVRPAEAAAAETTTTVPPVLRASPVEALEGRQPITGATAQGQSVSAPRAHAMPAEAVPVERTIRAETPEAERPTATTPRPQPRPDRAPRPAVSDIPRATPSPGTSTENARAGELQGQETGTVAQRQADGGTQSRASSREIARYPQIVNRHLGRLRRPASSFRGTTVVNFTISATGGLAAVQVVQSSGDPRFDELALAHIRGAVPFPAPPAGAQTQYSVAIRGR